MPLIVTAALFGPTACTVMDDVVALLTTREYSSVAGLNSGKMSKPDTERLFNAASLQSGVVYEAAFMRLRFVPSMNSQPVRIIAATTVTVIALTVLFIFSSLLLMVSCTCCGLLSSRMPEAIRGPRYRRVPLALPQVLLASRVGYVIEPHGRLVHVIHVSIGIGVV